MESTLVLTPSDSIRFCIEGFLNYDSAEIARGSNSLTLYYFHRNSFKPVWISTSRERNNVSKRRPNPVPISLILFLSVQEPLEGTEGKGIDYLTACVCSVFSSVH